MQTHRRIRSRTWVRLTFALLTWLAHGSVLAAITLNSATFGGAATTTVVVGDTIPVTMGVRTSGGGGADNWQSFGWRISTTPPGAMTCDDSPNFNNDVTADQVFDITAPTTPGTYNLYLIAYNANGCAGTNSGTLTLTAAITVVAAPLVTSISLASADPTNGAGSVSWTVSFNAAVTGVNASDFALVQAGGVSGAAITAVTGSGNSWTVTASTGTGTGTLGLNLVDNDSIVAAAVPLGGAGAGNGNFTGAVYTVSAFLCLPPNNIPAGVPVTCVCDNFNRSNLDPSTIYGQNWITSESDGTGIVPSIVNSGYLRLTNNTASNAKAATVPAAFPAAGNYISVEFDLFAYNGSGADGVAVTLSDYNVPAVPGAYGGSLGYAQRTGVPGFAGGWIGVAMDEYGNYQNPTEGRLGGPGFLVDSVGVRGSGSGNTGYRWLQGTAANLSPGIDNRTSTTPSYGHRYQVVVDARNAGLATPQTFVTVNRDITGSGSSYGALIPQFEAFSRAISLGFTQAAVPPNWQISFTGSTGGSTNIHELGNLRICAQTIIPPGGGVAAGFAAIDEAYGTPALAVQNYLTGRIYTKLAGTPFKLNIAAINNNQIQTGYVLSGTKTVNVRLVDNSDGVCVLNSSQANYCSAACKAKPAVAGGSQTMSFASSNAGQKQSTDFTVPDAWSRLAAIISDGSTTACSTDAFAVRPSALTSLSSTASNAALTGAPAFRAGSDSFSMTVATTTPGYAGAAAMPTIDPTATVANGAGWTLGTITPGSFPAATASSSTGSFTYSEVGHFRFLGYNPATDTTSPRGVYDSTWTAVDQTAQQDCITGSYANTRDTSGSFASNPNYGKFGCRFGITASTALFGRFVPDHFTLVSGSVTPVCTGTTRNFTYMGQAGLGVAYQIEARNSGDAKTLNYASSLYGAGVLPTPAVVAEDQAVANQGCDLATRLSGLSGGNWLAGVYTASTATASFSRPGSVPPGTLDASSAAQCVATRANAGGPFWSLDLGLQMVDGSAGIALPDMNAGSTGVCSGAGCNARRLGSTGEVLGRLNLLNAYGSDLLPLLVPVRAEYWNGSAWVLNTDDRCTTLGATTLGVGNITPASGSSLNVTSASLALNPSATLAGGVTNFRITPATRGAGSVDLVLNLGPGLASLVNWCGSWGSGPVAGTGTTPSPDLSFLTGNWCGAAADRAPAARVRFGSPKAPFIYLRERY